MEHRLLAKMRLYMDVSLSLRGVPGIGVPPIMRKTGVRLFMLNYKTRILSTSNHTQENRNFFLKNEKVATDSKRIWTNSFPGYSVPLKFRRNLKHSGKHIINKNGFCSKNP